ncbi:hypothetical protein ABD76_19560 [Paenibacillus dendritiformis]|nr:hypothetical protein [Paenibacillus dendritiformis]
MNSSNIWRYGCNGSRSGARGSAGSPLLDMVMRIEMKRDEVRQTRIAAAERKKFIIQPRRADGDDPLGRATAPKRPSRSDKFANTSLSSIVPAQNVRSSGDPLL